MGFGSGGSRLQARRVQPAARSLCPTRCPYVWLGFPFAVSQSGQCRGFERTRGAEGERETMSAPNYEKRDEEKKKEKNLWALDFWLRKGSYWHTERPPPPPPPLTTMTMTTTWRPKMRGEKTLKQCPLSRPDWKAAKSNYDCENVQTLVLAASKHRKSCGAVCLHWVDLWMPSGPGWALHALSTVDIHTHGASCTHIHALYELSKLPWLASRWF